MLPCRLLYLRKLYVLIQIYQKELWWQEATLRNTGSLSNSHPLLHMTSPKYTHQPQPTQFTIAIKNLNPSPLTGTPLTNSAHGVCAYPKRSSPRYPHRTSSTGPLWEWGSSNRASDGACCRHYWAGFCQPGRRSIVTWRGLRIPSWRNRRIHGSWVSFGFFAQITFFHHRPVIIYYWT